MANLKQTSITGSSGTTTLLVSGSSIVMPSMSGSVDSGSAAQMYIDVTPTAGLTMKLTQAGSFGSQNSPYTCLGAWSVGGNMINPRTSTSGTGFSNDSLLTAGGNDGSAMNETEEYDGSSWSAGGNMSISRWTQLTGTQNAATAGGGATPTRLTSTEEYDGASWSTGGAMNYAHADGAFSGQQNAGAYFGGYIGGPSLGTCTEFYNGSSWTTGPATPSNSFGGQAQGTSTATTLLLGGTSPSAPAYGASTCAIDFDGTTYNAITSTLFCHSVGAGYGQSSDNMGVVGGCTHGSNGCKTEEWHGVSWSLLPDLPVANRYIGGGGNINGSGAGVFGGGPVESATYNYTKVLTSPFTYNAAVTSDAWSGGPNMIQGRSNPGGTGTNNAALAFGGRITNSADSALTEEYNGSTWSAGGALINERTDFNDGAGTQNAGLAAGGIIIGGTVSALTEEYNGAAWSAQNTLIVARYDAGQGGTQNAAIMAGGGKNPTEVTCTETYNGTSWSAVNTMITANRGLSYGGTINSGMIIGGYGNAYNNQTEVWNGTSWASTTAFCRNSYQGSVAGDNSEDIISYSGYSPNAAQDSVYHWNGTAWSIYPSMPAAVWGAGRGGDASNAFAVGGQTPTFQGNIQFFDSGAPTCSTTPFCLATWSSGTSLTTARRYIAGAGTANAALAAGGSVPPATTALTEEYNGTAWAAGGALINAIANHTGVGTQNTALSIGGYAPGSPPHSGGSGVKANTEEYNGSTWSNGGALGTGNFEGASTGTQNAAIAFGGRGPAPSLADTNCTRHYDGSAWTAGGNLIAACSSNVGSGIENAALNINGTSTEEYNGTTWASGTALITARCVATAAGTQNDSILYGGYLAPATFYGKTERWNGISWSQEKQMSIPRRAMAISCMGTSNSALAVGGFTANPNLQSATEEFVCADYQVGAWSGAASMITARRAIGPSSQGTQNAALAGGGITPSALGNTEEYNGTSWSAGGALNTARSALNGTGTQNANASVGGSGALTCHEQYDGSSWSVKTAMITGVYYMGLTGTADAALKFSGYSNSYITSTEEWNGTSWATQNAVNSARTGLSGANGTQNATIWALGYGGSYNACHEHYDGTSWSVKSAVINSGEPGLAAIGTQNAYITSGQYNGSFNNITNEWNGLGWSLGVRHPVKGNQAGSSGTTESFITYGGQTPGVIASSFNYDVDNPVNQGIYCFTKTL